MFKKLLNKILTLKEKEDSSQNSAGQPKEERPQSAKIDQNLQALRQVFDLCSDITFRELRLNTKDSARAFIVFAHSLCDPTQINEAILKPIMQEIPNLPTELQLTKANVQQVILERLLHIRQAQTTTDLLQLVHFVLEGNLALVIDGSNTAIIASVQGMEQRAVNEPTTEPNVRGSRDGFVENLATNVSLIRRRIRSSRLKIETYEVGALTRTKIAVCYIQGIANDKIVEEVKQRLRRINTDSILTSGTIEEFIADQSFSLFPLVQYTERPDRTAGSLLEGRIALVVDNTPSVLLVPCTFLPLMQAAEDYSNTSPFATFIRVLRFLALNIALLLPALTVAVLSFQQDFLPNQLIETFSNTRQDLPFPIFVEIILIEFLFELLQEAGSRLPQTIGQAVSTVGGLVIGQDAVSAGFISPVTVIVVSLTAIASFTMPDYAAMNSIRILRFALIIPAAILGSVGVILGLMVILAHLCNLRSFGIPYLSPFAPLSLRDLKDSFIRVPWPFMKTRPRLFGAKEPVRQALRQGPTKPDKGGNRS